MFKPFANMLDNAKALFAAFRSSNTRHFLYSNRSVSCSVSIVDPNFMLPSNTLITLRTINR